MKKIRQFTVLMTPIVIFVIVEYIHLFRVSELRPYLVFYALGLVSIVLTVLLLCHARKVLEVFSFSITPIALLSAQFGLLLFLESPFLRHTAATVSGFFLVVFFENLFLRYDDAARYQEYTMGNISNLLNILVVYFTSASLFGLAVHLSLAVWAIALVAIGVVTLLTYQTLWITSPRLSRGWAYIAIIPFVFAEFFWVVNFLPSSIYVNAFLVTIFYYLLIGLGRNQILGILEKKTIYRYAAISGVTLIIVMATAKWS